jgi:lipid-A-disaccharide synthase
MLAKRFVKIKFIALVNLIMDKEVVKELIQENLTTKNLVAELNQLLTIEAVQRKIRTDYTSLKNILTTGHDASEVAAQIIMEELK